MVCGLIDEMMMPPPSDKKGQSEPFYESLALKALGIEKLKEVQKG